MSDTLTVINAANEAQRIANAGYGFVTQVARTTNATFTTETVIMTTSSVTFRAGRAFRVNLRGLCNAAGADYALFRIRKANVTGTIYVDQMRVNTMTGSSTANALLDVSPVLVNATSADITTALCLTAAQGTNAQTWTWAANSTTSLGYVLVEDCGSTVNYSGFPMS